MPCLAFPLDFLLSLSCYKWSSMTKTISSRMLHSTACQRAYPGCFNKARKFIKYQSELFIFSSRHPYLTYSLSGLWHHCTTKSPECQQRNHFHSSHTHSQSGQAHHCYLLRNTHICPLQLIPAITTFLWPLVTFILALVTVSCLVSTPPSFQSILLFAPKKDYPEMQV